MDQIFYYIGRKKKKQVEHYIQAKTYRDTGVVIQSKRTNYSFLFRRVVGIYFKEYL